MNPSPPDHPILRCLGQIASSVVTKPWVQAMSPVRRPFGGVTAMGQVGPDRVGDVRRHLEQLMRALPGRIRAAGVPAIELGGMLTAHGALDTARRLARPGARPYGFLDLHQVGRLDLSVEALVVTERFRSLFTAREVEYCELRLEAFEVDVAVVRRGANLGRPAAPPEPQWGQLPRRTRVVSVFLT